ncbi:uncharacterized protein LOC115030849 [Mus caroli]|uniref:Uncharacterized protein LOC115030849 n=1 Tax=Mus caroli TaxID=10089 RepID=A0A6P7QRJ3_MUSCR|nr:uncharacterized protein LOC115030849 [Mus caroli]
MAPPAPSQGEVSLWCPGKCNGQLQSQEAKSSLSVLGVGNAAAGGATLQPAAALVLRRAAAARAVRAAGARVDLGAPLLRPGTRESCGAEETARGGGVGLAARGEHTEMRNRCRSWTEPLRSPARSIPSPAAWV